MEEAKGLLQKPHDARVSTESESDLELDELGDDAPKPLHSQDGSPRSPRRRRLAVVAMVGALLLIVTAGGLFGYKSARPPDGLSPPWYPTPRGGCAPRWAESYRQAAALVSRMSLPEKVNITTGTGWMMGPAVGNTGPAIHVGFPSLALQDGPLGLRFADHATAFPAGITVGATWNRKLMYERGRALGEEARGKGINVLLGPSVGPLGRHPAGGRNWEGFGADPYLQGIAAAETIRGIQAQGVMATVKHWVANEQEHFRQAWAWGLPHALSSNVDDRTLHEVYAWPFADAVRAGVAGVMCAYNMVNNSYACGNAKLLNGVLKDELGFQGFVVSDWLAQRSGVASALAGLDMSMPGDGLGWRDGRALWGPNLSRAVLNGSLPVERLDDMVLRIVAAWYQLGQDSFGGPNFSSWTSDKTGVESPGSPSPQEERVVNSFVDVQADHASLARNIAAEGTVLLKNDGVLPLKPSGYGGRYRVGVFGEDAGPGDGPNACPDRGCNQGTLGSGWGSGAVEFPHLVTPWEAISKRFDENVTITPYLTNDIPGVEALSQDLCMVFINADAGEGYIAWSNVRGDRNDLEAQKGGDLLALEVGTHCGGGVGTTVVVMHAVGPVAVESWIDAPTVKAVIAAHLPGQESGSALADILFGEECPSGKLPYTMGRRLEDYGKGGQVMYYPNGVVPQQDFKEGVLVDYRHFDKNKIAPRFEFGYGLSYTTFSYSNLQITTKKARTPLPAPRPAAETHPPSLNSSIPAVEEARWPSTIRKLEGYIYPYITADIKPGTYPYPKGYSVKQPPSGAGGGEGGNPDLWEVYVQVSVDVRNTGPVAGQAVPQVYVSLPPVEQVEFPVRVLRGFDKVALEKGEGRRVEFDLRRRDLSYWDVGGQNWVIPEGGVGIAVGESSRDIRVEGTWF